MNKNLINYWATLCESIIPTDGIDEAKNRKPLSPEQKQFGTDGGFGLAYQDNDGAEIVRSIAPYLVQDPELLEGNITTFTSTKAKIASKCDDSQETKRLLSQLHNGVILLFRCSPGKISAEQIADVYNRATSENIGANEVVDLGDTIEYDRNHNYEFYAINIGKEFAKDDDKKDVAAASSDIEKLTVLLRGMTQDKGIAIKVVQGSKEEMSGYFYADSTEFDKLPDGDVTILFASAGKMDVEEVKSLISNAGLPTDNVVKVGSDIEEYDDKDNIVNFDAFAIEV